MENHTAKHFALQLGSLASLYLSLSFLLVLTFGVINLLFPDAADSVWQMESASSMVRIGIAMVSVFFPTYLVLTRIVNQNRRQEPTGNYLGLTKWLIYLSLLVGGAVLLGDLVALIMAFLEGEITQRFTLKALAVLIVVGMAFNYYLLDAKGYWLSNEKKSKLWGLLATVVVIFMLLVGFLNINSPAEVRERKLDEKQLSQLQEIQWQIQDYLVLNQELPDSLESLYRTEQPPAVPADRPAYRYELTETGFKLCATFNQASTRDEFYYDRPVALNSNQPTIVNPNNWSHATGEVCFERVVK